MPSTRSQGRAQPQLQFPRRRSCRASSRSKTPQPDEPQNLARIGPLSPGRPTDQPGPLAQRLAPPSPKHPCPASPRLPLSPRKRTGKSEEPDPRPGPDRQVLTHVLSQGDDNSRNVGAAPLGSPPKQSKPAARSPRKLRFDENSPASAPAVGPGPRRQETPPGSPAPSCGRRTPVARLFADSRCLYQQPLVRSRPDANVGSVSGSRFHGAKQALHTAAPERLLSREAERDAIVSFLQQKVLRRLPGSLYISGAPGTGKTACLTCVLQQMKVRGHPLVSSPGSGAGSNGRFWFSSIRPSWRRSRRCW